MPNQKSKAVTNTKPESKKIEQKKVITFAELKANYPSEYPCDHDIFKDQCAIKLAVSLQGAGASLKTYRGRTCWMHKGAKHALVAEELANWLSRRYLANWPEATNITGKDWEEKADGKTGVIFFKDYWLRKGQKTPSGDHIDLWDKDELTSSGLASLRRSLGIDAIDLTWIDDSLNYSDLRKSAKILLWEIK